MKSMDIDKLFTEKVSEYLNKGYIFCPQSMSGHQGEVGKIDLVKGKELIRVWLNDESSYKWSSDDPDTWYGNIRVLRVSKWIYEYTPKSDRTVWNSDVDTIEEYSFYMITQWKGGWYVDNLEEALRIQNLCRDRYHTTRNSTGRVYKHILTDDRAKTIASNYMKRVHGYQRLQWDKLAVNVSVASNLKTIYHVYYNGKGYKLS